MQAILQTGTMVLTQGSLEAVLPAQVAGPPPLDATGGWRGAGGLPACIPASAFAHKVRGGDAGVCVTACRVVGATRPHALGEGGDAGVWFLGLSAKP